MARRTTQEDIDREAARERAAKPNAWVTGYERDRYVDEKHINVTTTIGDLAGSHGRAYRALKNAGIEPARSSAGTIRLLVDESMPISRAKAVVVAALRADGIKVYDDPSDRAHSTKRSHATVSNEHVAERRKRDPGAWSSRGQLRDVARTAAAAVFAPRKITPSEAVIQKAKSAAFKAIQRHDPLAGTSDHPAAAYAHGVMDIAMEATEEARQRWEMFHQSLKKLRRR